MEKLFVGVAREVITPEVGCQLFGYRPDIFSTQVADDLTATAFYFRQGEKEALMISATVCTVKTALAQEICAEIEKSVGVPKENCILSATHTHSGPNVSGDVGWGDIDEKYCSSIFVPKILSACRQAKAAAEEATMGFAVGNSLVGINRRELTPRNTVNLGQNPWGPFNPRMTVISFKNKEKVIGNMIHYGCHGTAAGMNTEITRDWSGLMTDAVERISGAITAFFNGPEGDVGPRLSNGGTCGDLSHVHELGAIAARDAMDIYRNILSYHEVPLLVSEKTLEIPLAPRMSVEEATALFEANKDMVRNLGKKRREHALEVLASYENGYVEEEYFGFSQTAVGIGNVVFLGTPFELFSEIGMRINQMFPQMEILNLSNANGCEGYFATEDVLCRGGYEVDSYKYKYIQPFCENADFEMFKASVDHVESMIKE